MSAALVTLLFLLSGPAQIAVPAQVAAASAQISLPDTSLTPATSAISGGVYANSYFRLSYRLPEGWQSGSPGNPFEAGRAEYREQPSSSDVHQDETNKYLLLSAGESGTNNSVQVVAYDTASEPSVTSGDVAQAEIGALLTLGGTAGGISETTIGGRTFYVGKAQISGEVRGQRQPVYAGVAATKDGNFILTWSFFADSAAHLEEMLGTLDSIRFQQ